MNSIDLTGQKVIAARDVEAAIRLGVSELLVCEKTVLTPSARDLIEARKIALCQAPESNGKAGSCGCAGNGCKSCPGAAGKAAANGNGAHIAVNGGAYTPAPAPVNGAARPVTAPQVSGDVLRLWNSPEAEGIKKEIVEVGHKLWHRAYVDGNGGNISYRIGPNAVICTPTLISKLDLTTDDLCLVDLQGNQLAGKRPRTSEILLHLEIYKAVPEAKSAVHCHPPHATAYAITGRVPPTCIIPEFEVFVGKVALSPYETPGTQKFAETVIPYVKTHNTVLLGNHGVICWADTVTHAEWCVEVLDSYCWTLMLATQIGQPISYIPADKTGALLDIKKKLGMPDPRRDAAPVSGSDMRECRLCDMPEDPGGISVAPAACGLKPAAPESQDLETIIQGVTDAVMAALAGR